MMKKRLWSIALALVMCLSLLPAAALAGEPASPFDYITVSGTGVNPSAGREHDDFAMVSVHINRRFPKAAASMASMARMLKRPASRSRQLV